MPVTTDRLAAELGYHNLSSLVWIIVCSNEAMVVVEGVRTTVYVDTGCQVSTLIEEFCLEFGFKNFPQGGLLHLKGT